MTVVVLRLKRPVATSSRVRGRAGRGIRSLRPAAMLIEHRGRRPVVDPSATVAPTAVLSGDVRVGARSRILHGAVLTAEDGAIVVGEECVVMEHASCAVGRGIRSSSAITCSSARTRT